MSATPILAIPYAGGNKYAFKGFEASLSSAYKLVTFEFPGRGARIAEPLLNDFEAIVRDLHRQIKPYLHAPFVLYGHSMGGRLGHRLIQHLQQQQERLPQLFLVTGCAAPESMDYQQQRYLLDDTRFKAMLKKLGGFPKEVLASNELMAFLLPIIRADFQALETSTCKPGPPYPVPVVAVAGDQENITDAQLQLWEKETSASFKQYRLPGNHFFIHQHYPQLATVFKTYAKNIVTRSLG
jgi:surfactin synthase thioesterase subunit